MVDPITVGTGLMVAVSAARKALETADDLSSIGGLLDSVFKAEAKEKEKQKAADKKLSHNQKAVEQRIGADSADAAGVELAQVASARVAELEHAEALTKLGRQLDARFGYGTWTSIQEEFKQKAAVAKKQARAAKERQRLLKEEKHALIKRIALEFLKGGVVIALITGFVLWIMWIDGSR